MRLNRYIANCGYCSRRDADKIISTGMVKINGKVMCDFSTRIHDEDIVTIRNQQLKLPACPRLWLYNKSKGLISSRVAQMGRKTIFQDLPKEMPRVMSAGRLDYNTEGLMILANDGEIIRHISAPGLLRKYKVRAYIKNKVCDFADRVEQVRKGINIEGVQYRGVKITLCEEGLRNNNTTSYNQWFDVELHEGKNREVRRIFVYLGLEINRLIRVQYGPFLLGNLKSGMTKELDYGYFSRILNLPVSIN